VADGLAAAHERGVVHRDVKPANIMLTLTGAKVFDFGIAASAGQVDEVDADGHIMGTPSYLAPERLIGGPVVPATDVYALALLMFRLLTGEQPRAVDDAYSQPAPLPPMPGVPAEIVELYRRGVQKEPHRRPTATEAAAVLRAATAPPPEADASAAFTQSSGLPAAPAIGVPVEPTPPASRTDVRPPALVAACLAVLAALALVVTSAPAGTVSPSQPARPVETMGQRPGWH
jgi:serine/threonine-protein kinase